MSEKVRTSEFRKVRKSPNYGVRGSCLNPFMSDQLQLADWLEELAVFGTPRHMIASDTAHHLAQVLRHGYIVRLGIEPPRRKEAPRRLALQELDASLTGRPAQDRESAAGKHIFSLSKSYRRYAIVNEEKVDELHLHACPRNPRLGKSLRPPENRRKTGGKLDE